MIDTDAIIKSFLATDTALAVLVGTRIYCPRLPEGATLPAIGFFTRGGTSTPYIPEIPEPSVQFDCWAKDEEIAGVEVKGSIVARQVYRALYDALQGIQNVAVGSNYILSAREEVQGQDLIDPDTGWNRVLTFFEIMVR